MATVWAYRVSAFRNNPASGWSHTVNFSNVPDLLNKLEEANLRNGVTRMAIVAHGDLPSQVIMDGTTPVLPGTLRDLSTYLQASAMLSFVSCIAGAGDGGTMFLNNVSRNLPDRVIVGFSTWGFVDASFGAPNDPGNVQAAPGASRPAPRNSAPLAMGRLGKMGLPGSNCSYSGRRAE